MEMEEDAKSRFTVAILSSSRPPRPDPEVLSRGQAGGRPKDVTASLLASASPRFPLGATFAGGGLLQFLGCKVSRRGIMDFGMNQYRILGIDQFSGHLALEVIGSTVRAHSWAPIFIWGGPSGLVQVADVYQKRVSKKVYRSEESKA